MKKFFVGIFLFFVIFFIDPHSASAACTQPGNNVGQCGRGLIKCNLNGSPYCCDQAGGGCSQLPGSVQQTMAPPVISGDSSNPACDGSDASSGINTAIGCIPVEDTNAFMGWILGWAIGVGGGIAFLLIVYASFMTMTSQGNPERLKAGQELLTSAISGLIMLIFSVFILKFIGIDILKLNDFGFGQ